MTTVASMQLKTLTVGKVTTVIYVASYIHKWKTWVEILVHEHS